MRILLIHQNFPGQFRHLAEHLSKDSQYEVLALCQPQAPKLKAVKTIQYEPARTISKDVHHYNRPIESHTLNGQAVAKVLMQLKDAGFYPDVVLGHAAWGEILYVKDVYPNTKLVGFFEFYYHATGADTDFDPAFPQAFDDVLRIRNKNTTHLLSLEVADDGVCPMQWQKNTFPEPFQYKLQQVFEGINAGFVKPADDVVFTLPNGDEVSQQDEVITYVSRNLEPYRGIHQFLRAVEIIQQRRPNVQCLIVGGDEVSYGRKLPEGHCWREVMLKEVKLDTSRVHFLGRLPYQDYLKMLQVSSAHIYLTVPFVLSWSMLEAMALKCNVIASDTAPVQEVIKHEKNGLLVDFFSPAAIADTADKVLDHYDDYADMREAARATIVNGYTIEQGIQQYLDIFSQK